MHLSTVDWAIMGSFFLVSLLIGVAVSRTAGKSFSHKFTKAGTYRYYCSFHGSEGGGDMSGTITVTR